MTCSDIFALLCIASIFPLTYPAAFCMDLYCSAQTLQHLVDAYKQHWSEEVANHNQREQNWVLIQEEWEKLEKQMEQEIIR